ncbi:HNH endonuclease [uncultured Chryseobacterium sp.]|uniref:HNH endonuclease n=1 Tax=uncultured Chryseobacterium sp. TaxID=259322 RepID=UPI0025F1EDAD|nr:HNH endonuclease [uncultured Chryseobacterium sp.]
MTETEVSFTNWLINKDYAFSTIDAYPYWIGSRLTKTFMIPDIQNLLEINDIDFLKNLEIKYMSRKLNKTEQDLRSAMRKYIEFKIFSESNKDVLKIEEENYARLSFTEGGQKVIISKMIERNKSLRNEAIKIHKLNCQVCGFNFEEYYGNLGKDFIEVHHSTPLSKSYIPKIVNPKTDLSVVCSNCHKMIHRKKNITLSIVELKRKLKK